MPMAPRLVGRARERSVLEEALRSSDPELVAVYGRRRVGKTFLVRETLGLAVLFELTGVYGAPRDEQLRNFDAALEAAGEGVNERSADWLDAFQRLQAALTPRLKRGPKRAIFIDELPWLASRKSGFLRAFEHFWNTWASRQSRLVVVICGSAASWMIERILRAKGGLHNRVTRRLRLLPFTLEETQALFESRNIRLEPYQVVELYMAMGGIPHYLREVRRGRSAAQNIERICFDRDGLLHDEFSNLYPSLFERPERHEAIVRVLASSPGGLNRTELLERADLTSGGRTSGVLSELEASGFITRASAFGRPVKDAIYLLTDEYSLFYLKWIEPFRGRSRNPWSARRNSPSWRAWSGLAYESVWRKHVDVLKAALGIASVETSESTWHYRPVDPADRGAQIDLLIDRRDQCINVCEIKFSEGPFVIDKRYAEDLRHKLRAFQGVSKTKKALFLTFVTTHGVRPNRYRDELVDAEVTIQQLVNTRR